MRLLPPPTILTRREALRHALGAAAASVAAPSALRAAPVAALPKSDPFRLLGIASGDPTDTSLVLWSRLALDLADTERWGLDADAYRVTWELWPGDRPKGRPFRTGTALAARDKGYAMHVEVGGLLPARGYAYRFRIGGFEASGRSRTAPHPNQLLQHMKLCVSSCAEYENELYFAYDQMARESPDLIVHLGDYIYEETYDRYYRTGVDERARRLKFDREQPLKTLAQYRRRYAEHKTDAMLQRAHAAAPWVVTWDDHEVSNDYAGGSPGEKDEQGFLERRIAAYRAFFENMPIRLSTLPVRDSRRQLYRRLGFGRLLDLHMLDERQYRDPQACRFDNLPGGKNVGLADCPAVEANRAMLGAEQEQWLAAGLARSKARWNVIAQGVMFAHLETRGDPRLGGKRTDPHMWNDVWAGYLPARQRIIDLLARERPKNPIVVSGDIHAHFVNRVFRDWRKPGVELVAPEFVTTSVSSHVRDLTPIVSDVANKDVVAYHGKSSHGYISCDVTPQAFEATMVRIEAKDRVAGTSTANRSARFRIEHGNPEPRPIG